MFTIYIVQYYTKRHWTNQAQTGPPKKKNWQKRKTRQRKLWERGKAQKAKFETENVTQTARTHSLPCIALYRVTSLTITLVSDKGEAKGKVWLESKEKWLGWLLSVLLLPHSPGPIISRRSEKKGKWTEKPICLQKQCHSTKEKTENDKKQEANPKM